MELSRVVQKPVVERPEWELRVFKNEMRRIVGVHLKDGNLRRKMEKELMEVMEEIEGSFRSTVNQIIAELE